MENGLELTEDLKERLRGDEKSWVTWGRVEWKMSQGEHSNEEWSVVPDDFKN